MIKGIEYVNRSISWLNYVENILQIHFYLVSSNQMHNNGGHLGGND